MVNEYIGMYVLFVGSISNSAYCQASVNINPLSVMLDNGHV